MKNKENDNNPTPPVELTDEEMEQASGGRITNVPKKEDYETEEEYWDAMRKLGNYYYGPYNCPNCEKKAVYAKSMLGGIGYTAASCKCFNCSWTAQHLELGWTY